MDVGLGSPGLYLLLCGGLAAGAGKALARRDGASALALGIAAVAAGQGAGLSAHLLAVAWTVVAIGLISAAGSVAVKRLTGAGSAFGVAMVATLGVLGAMATQPAHAGETPLAIGIAVHQQVATIIGG